MPPARLMALAFLGSVSIFGPISAVAQISERTTGKMSPELISLLSDAIQYEVKDKELGAFSLSINDRGSSWMMSVGIRSEDGQKRADLDTVYRVGSVSKLFTNLAVMQLVESGRLDLDSPVQRYLPTFTPGNEFDKKITLRQLMSHRSGLVREPPVGNYFNPDEPSLAATVASLNKTALVYEPESRTKYSNAALAVVGLVVERVAGIEFEQYVQNLILSPLEMEHSGFQRRPSINENLSDAVMWGYDGREFAAPTFQLGTGPAGNLYSSITDMNRFVEMLINGGQLEGQRVLKDETLRSMWQAQFDDEGGYGLGFRLSKFGDKRRIGHGGAVYGFSTNLAVLIDDHIGVAAVAARDFSNGIVTHLTEYALALVLAEREGNKLPAYGRAAKMPIAEVRKLKGTYSSEDGARSIYLYEQGGELMLKRAVSVTRIRRHGENLIGDSVWGYGPPIDVRDDGEELMVGKELYRRQSDRQPDRAPEEFEGLIGEYGWDHNTLFVLESAGRLYALIEWVFFYALEKVSEDTYAFPDYGLYHGERMKFVRDGNGRASHVVAAEVRFERRAGQEEGETFRIEPIHPIEHLRRIAMKGTPPEESGKLEPELTEVVALDDSIRLDIRYASTNNFMGAEFYPTPQAFLQRPAAVALAKVHQKLSEAGFGMVIHDCYRPWHVTKMFYDATPESLKHFVANPARGSRHNRGCAVDLSLYVRETGEVVSMPSGYDEFSPRAYPSYPGGTSLQRWYREKLRDAMQAGGFEVYEYEWWHFDYKDWQKYPILNVPFEKLNAARE